MNSPYQNNSGLPLKDILSEIRELISKEAGQRYNVERTRTKRELLILRPEARVDLLLAEPEAIINVPTAKPIKAVKPAAARQQNLEPLGVASLNELREVIREIVVEEIAKINLASTA